MNPTVETSLSSRDRKFDYLSPSAPYKVPKYRGGIPFTYDPLAHFLRNRIYLGETGHGGKWFKGEHQAVVDRAAFDKVQLLLIAKATNQNVTRSRSESGALLMCKLYDDKGIVRTRVSPARTKFAIGPYQLGAAPRTKGRSGPSQPHRCRRNRGHSSGRP
jgi:hypothetical protein